MAGEIRLVKSCSPHITAITQKEISILLNTISKSTDTLAQRDKTLFAVYAFTGIRKSEALALRISDYDNVSKTLHLPLTKRSSKKFQAIPSILSQILDEYLSDNPACRTGKFDSISINSSLPLFSGKRFNTHLSCRQVTYRYEKWKIISGIRKNLTIHSFRSWYASQLYRKTKDPLLVSYALGHSSFNSTKAYIVEDYYDITSVLDTIFCATY